MNVMNLFNTTQVVLNFYEELSNLPSKSSSMNELRLTLAEKYNMEMADVNELVIYYLDQDKIKKFITDDLEFNQAMFYFKQLDSKAIGEIIVEISTESRLYKEQNEIQDKKENEASESDRIKKEIQEKTRMLEEIIKKEQSERERKMQEEEAMRINREAELISVAEEKLKMEKMLIAKTEKLLKEKDAKKNALNVLKLNAKIEKKEKKEIKKEAKKDAKKEAKKEITVAHIKVSKEDKIKLEAEIEGIVAANLEKFKKSLVESTLKQTISTIQNNYPKNESVESSSSSKPEVLHSHVQCDGCGMAPLKGTRYQCTVCHNFDYCESCEELNSETHQHPFLKIRKPNNKTGFVKCGIRNMNCFVDSMKKKAKQIEIPEEMKKVVENVVENVTKGMEHVMKTQEKVEKIEEKVEKTKVVEEERKYTKELLGMRRMYGLGDIKDEELYYALEATDGNEEMALGLLFA